MIMDQRIPFEVAAFDNATFTQLVLDWEDESRTIAKKCDRSTAKGDHKKLRSKRE
jgi:hypothetical protein